MSKLAIFHFCLLLYLFHLFNRQNSPKRHLAERMMSNRGKRPKNPVSFTQLVHNACKSGPNLKSPMGVNSIFIKDKYTVCCILRHIFYCASGSEIKNAIFPQAQETHRESFLLHTLTNRFPMHKSHIIIVNHPNYSAPSEHSVFITEHWTNSLGTCCNFCFWLKAHMLHRY